MAAAIRVIAAQGLSAPTALIAREAGVSNGSLFTYFETKADLFNSLYLELKTEMATTALKGFPAGNDLRRQLFHVWSNWLGMPSSKRRTLVQLNVSDEITPATREAAHATMAGLADLLERVRANGQLSNAPMGFVVAIVNSLAEATMDFMTHDPSHADQHCMTGFDALWRVLA